jgi:pyruvate dehydrogenase E1 component alpha subunit
VNARTVLNAEGSNYDLESLRTAETRVWEAENGQPFRLIEEDGAARDPLAADLPEATLRAMYEEMLQLRSMDERAVNLQRQGRIGFYVPSTGEEAAQIGSAHALTPTDWVFTAYRELGIALHRGLPLEVVFNQLLGNSGDLLKGRQMPNHYGSAAIRFTVASSPVGTQIPQAVGAAYASRYRGEPDVTIVYFGDGATSTGDFHAAMNLAGVQRLPVIFFCKNNGWAISLPRERQTASATLAQKALAYGFEGVRVDGNDVLAVCQVTRAAAEKARRGGGPTLIEAITYRVGPHSTADDPTRYRALEEVEAWRGRDPLTRYRTFLEGRGLWTAADDESARAAFAARLDAAIAAAEALPPPPAGSLFEEVYAEMPWHLREQRAELAGSERES